MNSAYLSVETLSALINRTLDNTPSSDSSLMFSFNFKREANSNHSYLFRFTLKMADLEQRTPQEIVDLINSKLVYFDNVSANFVSFLDEVKFALNNDRLEVLIKEGSSFTFRKETNITSTGNELNIYGDAFNIFDIIGSTYALNADVIDTNIYNSSLNSVELYLFPVAGYGNNGYFKIYNALTNDLLFSKDLGDVTVNANRLTPELVAEIQAALTAGGVNLTAEHVVFNGDGYDENRLRLSTIDASVYNLIRIESSPVSIAQTNYSGVSSYDLLNVNSTLMISLGGPEPFVEEVVIDTSNLTLVYKSEHSMLDLLNGILPTGFENLTNESFISVYLEQKYPNNDPGYINTPMISLGTLTGLSFKQFSSIVWLNDYWGEGDNLTITRYVELDENGKLCVYTDGSPVIFRNNDYSSQGDTPLNDIYSLFEILGGEFTNGGELVPIGNVVDCKLPSGEPSGSFIDLAQFTQDNEAREIPIKFYDLTTKAYLGEVILNSRVGVGDSFSEDSVDKINNFFIENNIPLNATVGLYDDDWEYESIRIYNSSANPCVGILIDGIEVYIPWTYTNAIAHYDTVDGRTLTAFQLTSNATPPPAVRFLNTHSKDRKVKLVPKTEQAKVSSFDGSDLEIVEMDGGALGFCLAGNPCYGSTPALAVEVNPTSTFDLVIAGTEYTDLTYDELRAVLLSNGLEIAEFKNATSELVTA